MIEQGTMTPLTYSSYFSEKYGKDIWFKREDLQEIRSYKIRGVRKFLERNPVIGTVVCASAGNHAQGVAKVCRELGLTARIFMPRVTPRQKIDRVRRFGGDSVEIVLLGDTYDECYQSALKEPGTFIPAFDHPDVILGQSEVTWEILEQKPGIDTLIAPMGGGGLAAGATLVLPTQVRLVTAEPAGAPSFAAALKEGCPVKLGKIDTFVDGAALQKVGDITFAHCQNRVAQHLLVPEGAVCGAMIELYNQEGIIVEPAGALSVAALEQITEGNTIVCILSGGNNDITRMAEVQERAMRHQGLHHYFLVNFANRPGSLKEFAMEVLGPTDDIIRFEFIKRSNREQGTALIGIELQSREHLPRLLESMNGKGVSFVAINDHDTLAGYLI